ncbi:PQQ-dependent sugar dehydrogenase [Luteolibacter arcticus]|uniref:PQQ-dependent sugar dehydrogenase n=1 Tax=Luteolibacter arcticus TaxID=1581411 RepID=A0ABT3GNF0_9BACT|nr:PQQ-dependent sugar dehydrogenase [Luteolibacter arcticus]MCW1925043.1 PQQ-dependent sugar dehydrogenase [Luteolibacter arcticus]
MNFPHPRHRLLSTAALLALASSWAMAAEIQSTTVAEKLRDPMEIAVVPNGDLIVIEREGRVLRVRPSTGGVFELGTVPVTALRATDTNSPWAREDGLLGLALDPAFTKNRRLYLYFSHPEKMLNRLSRFELKDGKLDLSSEKVLLDIPTDRRDKVCHQAGSLAFGPDGLLHLSTGDNTNPFESGGFAPIDDRDGRDHVNAMRSAGSTNDLRGKILRIRPTESGYEIPKGNLFPPGTAKTCPEIYAMGCRNPFRLSIDPKTRVVYWGEVGPDAGGAGAKGPAGHDEVNQAKQAGNFGWPFVIADNRPYPIVDFTTGKPGEMTDPAKPKNPGKHNTGLVDLPPAQKAFIWYPYGNSPEFPAVGGGGRNAMAGPVFYYDARRKFNLLDKSDDHTLLTYDWMRGRMWKAKLGREEKLEKLEPLMDQLMHPMDLEMAADGTLWLLEYGGDWYFNKNGRIRSLRPADGNKPPAVTVAATGTTGTTYTATASDPDKDRVSVEWWVTRGANETKVGSGNSITLSGGGSELRAVATDAKGAVTVARVALEQEQTLPQLALELAGKPDKLGFGEEVGFTIKGAADPAKLIVRARYIPPTGHDAGGPQLPPEIEKLATSRQCFACHQVDKTSVGPAYLDVAMKYREQANAAAHLQAKLKTGGGGVWGEVPMPPQAAVTDAEGESIIRAILGLAQGMAETRGSGAGKLRLSPPLGSAQPGGAWEITAEAPGHTAARMRVAAK